jgi:hypothetical protein
MFKWLILTGRFQQTDYCCIHLSSLRESKNGSYFLFLKKEKPSRCPEDFVQTVSSASLAVQGFFERGSTLSRFDF